MGRDEYAALDVNTQRAVYIAMCDIIRYTMGKKDANCAVRAQNPIEPADWIVAIKRVTCSCERCRGTGTYRWGACINGSMSHSAPCARCNGKGRMDFDDMRRGRAYDKYAICRAAR